MDRPVLHAFVQQLVENERLVELADALPTRVRVSEPALPLLLASLHERLGRDLVVLLPEDADARDAAEAASWFLGGDAVGLLPSRGVTWESGLTPPPHLVGERARALHVLERGGLVCASARALAEGLPPAASTPSARARSPTRCAGGSSPEPRATPRLGRRATRLGSRYQPTASAVSRASSSSPRRQISARSSDWCSAASTRGSAGSDTRAAAGKAATKSRKRSSEPSASTSGARGVGAWSMRLAGTASRRAIVALRFTWARAGLDPRSGDGRTSASA